MNRGLVLGIVMAGYVLFCNWDGSTSWATGGGTQKEKSPKEIQRAGSDLPLPAVTKGKKVIDTFIKAEDSLVEFTIVGDGALGPYQTLKLAKPTRLVLDVKGVEARLRRNTIHGKGPLIRDIRIGKHPDKVRFVLYLEGKEVPPYQIEAKENRLIISFKSALKKPPPERSDASSSPAEKVEPENAKEPKSLALEEKKENSSSVGQSVTPGETSETPKVVATAKDPEKSLNVGQLVEEALQNNPEILAAKKKWEVYKEKIPQAYALSDPMLGLGISNLPTNFSFREEGMTMKEISISQMFPFPGKRPLMKEMAEKEAEAAYTEVQARVQQVAKEVKAAYYDLAHVDRAMEVIQRNKEILQGFARIAETRYSVGEGIQQDVVKAHLEVSKMVDELLMQEQKRRALAAKLNALLNRPPETSIGRPAEVVSRRLPYSVAELQQMALDTNPFLKGMQKMIEARTKAHDLAKREYYPDFTFKVAYGQRDNGPDMKRRDMLTGMMEVNIPIFYKSKQDRKVAETQAEIQRAEAQYRAMRNEILFMVADMVSMIQRLEKQVDLYRTGIIPQTSLQIASAMSAYRVNRADFMTLLDSQMTLYRYELEYHQALTEYEKSVASLEAVVGMELFEKGERK